MHLESISYGGSDMLKYEETDKAEELIKYHITG